MALEFKSSTKSLGLFSLVMINVIAVDNLRSLTAGAEYGFALVFFYLLVAALFFIPSALVTAELATAWPNTGGVYVWVREAFGQKVGFLTIWLQWIYNVVWYPTIFSFIAGIIAYIISPALVHSKWYMLSTTLGLFWAVTLLNCFGLKLSTWISAVGAIVGTIFPMLFIAVLGLCWVILGYPRHIEFSAAHFFPNLAHFNNIAFMTNIVFGLMGIEMAAVHAGDVKTPERNYPRALLISSCIILFTLMFACLAIAIVIPTHELNLVSGLIDAFGIFFTAYHLTWFTPILAILIIIGSLSSAAAWVMGPARGLQVAAAENALPAFVNRVNKHNMPVGVLLLQGLLVTLLSSVFFIMPTVNASYWVLSNLTAQLALLFYILFFITALRLRYKHPAVARSFRIPGGKYGIWLVCIMGALTSAVVFILGFIPPQQIHIGNIFIYEAILVFGIIIFCLPPFLLARKRSSKQNLLHTQ